MSAQGPLVLGLGLKGLGLRVWGQGLTIQTLVSLDAWLPYCDIVFTLQTEDTFLYKKYILYNRYCHLVHICYVTLHCTKGRSRQTGQHFSCDFSVSLSPQSPWHYLLIRTCLGLGMAVWD